MRKKQGEGIDKEERSLEQNRRQMRKIIMDRKEIYGKKERKMERKIRKQGK